MSLLKVRKASQEERFVSIVVAGGLYNSLIIYVWLGGKELINYMTWHFYIDPIPPLFTAVIINFSCKHRGNSGAGIQTDISHSDLFFEDTVFAFC